MPVDAHKMSPQVSVLGSSLDSLHGTVNVRAQEALDFSALLLLVIHEFLASITVPAACWDSVLELATVACLMDGNEAQIADDDLIILVVFVIKADVTDYLFIVRILFDSNKRIRVSWIPGLLLSDLLHLLILLRGRCLLVLVGVLEVPDPSFLKLS